jgi:two-component sensor histidine kinase
VRRKLLAFINVRVLAFAVVAPVVALGGISGYIIANQKRLSVEQSVEQMVRATLYAAERELSKHLAAAEILASMVDLNRLESFTEHMDEIMSLRKGEWLNVIIMDKAAHAYNYMRSQLGKPLPVSLRPDLDALVMESGRYHISPVLVSERYSEPYYQIRVPIFDPGSNEVRHVLCVVVRAWTLTNAARAADPPPHWRIGILDPLRMIVGRASATGPNDPLIAKISTQVSNVPTDASGLTLTRTVDNLTLYAARVESKMYPGWSAAVGVPRDEIDNTVYRSIYALSIGGGSTIAVACLLCFVLIRTYARRATTFALEDSLREKETLLRELHHRVKNNMQGTVGILLFERSRIKDDYARERLRVISDRISVQGRVHQQLYETGDLHRIEFGTFLNELCQGIMATLCEESAEIKLSVDADTLHCDIDMAMPLGLITNELMTNAVKHGFKDGQPGEIMVRLNRREDAVVLSVSDTGVGCLHSSKCLNETTTQGHGIGTTLVRELARQIDSEFTLMQDITGTTARVLIPLDGFRS